MLFVCFLVMFDSFSVKPQEVPLPGTFINPAFQVAHHLWWVKFSSNLFHFLKWWPVYWLGAFVTVKWIVVIDWLCPRAVWGGVRTNENWCSWGWWLLALSHDVLYAYRLLQAGILLSRRALTCWDLLGIQDHPMSWLLDGCTNQIKVFRHMHFLTMAEVDCWCIHTTLSKHTQCNWS